MCFANTRQDKRSFSRGISAADTFSTHTYTPSRRRRFNRPRVPALGSIPLCPTVPLPICLGRSALLRFAQPHVTGLCIGEGLKPEGFHFITSSPCARKSGTFGRIKMSLMSLATLRLYFVLFFFYKRKRCAVFNFIVGGAGGGVVLVCVYICT